MRQVFKAFSVYGIAYGALLIIALGLLCAYPKVELHLLLNSHHTGIQDTFFKYYSMLAEGVLYVLALLPLFWKKFRITLFFGLCELSGGAVIQILKRLFPSQRPLSVFENAGDILFPMVEGVDLNDGNSFPSGHSFTFFAFCTCCALILSYYYIRKADQTNRRTWALFNVSLLVLLTLAALGAFSRVYLSQHFLSDICMGSIIGFVTPCLMFYFAGKKILKLKFE